MNDIKECIVQLAKRAVELEESELASILYTVAASIEDESINELVMLTKCYSMIKLRSIDNDTSSSTE